MTTAPPPTLEDTVAPDTVKPELAGVLADMLRRGEGDFVLPLGNDHARCALTSDKGRATLDCGELREETSSLAQLVRAIHGGEVGRRILEWRLRDGARFAAHTGLRPGMLRDLGEPGLLRDLGEPLGEVRFGVRGGAAVWARLEGAEGPEEKEAGSLLELGRWLAERGEALPRERASVAYRARLREGLEQALGRIEQGSKGWGIDGVRVGVPQAEQPAIAAARTDPHGDIGQVWPRRLRIGAFVGGQLAAPLEQSWSHFEAFDGRVTRVEQGYRWKPARPEGERLDCGALTRWLGERRPGFASAPARHEAECRWQLRQGPIEAEVTVHQEGHAQVAVRLLDAALGALEARAKARVEASERAKICRVCGLLYPGKRVHVYYEVVSVNHKACTAKLRAISQGMGGQIEVGSQVEEPCDARNTYE